MENIKNCSCGNTTSYNLCCAVIHNDPKKANSAEELMRARYTAFTLHKIDFIYNTFAPTTRRFQNKKEIELWATQSKWLQLEIIKSTEATVEFKAQYLDQTFEIQTHHEKSNFKKIQGQWFYVDGKIMS